jgi:TP901 family phage tail tape measure protein
MAAETFRNIIELILQAKVDSSQAKIGLRGIETEMKKLGLSAQSIFQNLNPAKSLVSAFDSAGKKLVALRMNLQDSKGAWAEYNVLMQNSGKSGQYLVTSISKVDESLQKQSKTAKDTSKSQDTLKKSTDSVSSSFVKMFKRSAAIVPAWFLVRQSYMQLLALFQSSLRFLVEWETVMSKIAVVSGGTQEQLKNLSKDLLQLGTAFGLSTKDLGEGARLWAQQGKSYSEIIPLMKTTSSLALITGRSVSDSVEDITSIMYSFGLQAEDTGRILDALASIDMKFAITTDVMVSALRKVGPVANQMGLSLEKTLSIITATHLATRAEGSEIGNAWKTIFTRMTTSAREAIQSLGQVPIYLTESGEATKTNTGYFRDWSDIIDDLAKSFDTLNPVMKEQLAVELTGVRQITKLKAALQQWQEGMEALKVAQNSQGQGQRAVNILLDTTAIKAQRLGNAWNELVYAMGDTRALKTTLDILREILLTTKNLVELDLADKFPLEGILGIGETLAKKVDFGKLAKNALQGPIGLIQPQKADVDKFKTTEDTVTEKVTEEVAKARALNKAKKEGLFLDEKTQKIELQKIEDLKNYGFLDSDIIERKLEFLGKYQQYEDKNIDNLKLELELQKQLTTKKDNFSRLLKDDEITQKKLETQGYNRIQIATREVAKYEELRKLRLASEDEVMDKKRELLKLIQEEIGLYASELQSTLSGGLTDFLKGEKTIGQVGEGVASYMKDAVLSAFSQGVVEKVFQFTKVGEMWGIQISNIRHLFEKQPKNLYEMILKAHTDGGEELYDWIKRGHVDGWNLAQTGQGTGLVGLGKSTSYSSKQGGFLQNLMGMFGGMFQNASGIMSLFGGSGLSSSLQSSMGNLGLGNIQNVGFPTSGNLQMSGLKPGTQLSVQNGQLVQVAAPIQSQGMLSGFMSNLTGGAGASSLAGMGSMLGTFGGGALSAYSAFKGAGGGWQGGTAAGMAGASSIAALIPGVGPFISAGLMVGSMLMGLFKKSKTIQEDTKTEIKQISSKIQVSNKQLEIVNRNLVAIRAEKTFILPESAYFSSNVGTLEDQFALHANRGLAF